MATYTFTTPYVEEGPTGQHRLFYFFKLRQGLTVVKSGGTWSTGRWFNEDQLATFDAYYLGGRNHTGVSEARKTELLAAGLGITEANFTAE
jgi:hypothetical protein